MPLRIFRSYSPPAVLPAVASAAFLPAFCRLFAGSFAGLRRPTHAVSCCLVLPRIAPCSSCAGRAIRMGAMRKAAATFRCSGLVALPYLLCCLCRIQPGNPAGGAPGNLAGVDPGNPVGMLTREILRALARKILRGCLSGVFYMGARDPRVARLPGRQARTFTGYGFGRRRVSAPRFPTDALRFRLFSKGILPAATVSCTRNCGGRSPASSW